uniref:Msx2-interacting protein n=1 Tax=Lygus hesperus TaxID=30085 RepID=A0A0A9YVD5_LYGHE
MSGKQVGENMLLNESSDDDDNSTSNDNINDSSTNTDSSEEESATNRRVTVPQKVHSPQNTTATGASPTNTNSTVPLPTSPMEEVKPNPSSTRERAAVVNGKNRT